MKIFFTIAFSIFIGFVDGFSQAAVRMIANEVHQGQLIVDLEMRATDEAFTLSNHNLRIYYNTEMAKLSSFYSALPTDIFDDIEISEMKQNIAASIVQKLSYDRDLGFVNLKTSHNPSSDQELKITAEWVKIGSLVFTGSGNLNQMEATWARPNITADYATAYVEITQWENGQSSEVVVEQYEDLVWSGKGSLEYAPLLTIGPNPSADYVMVAHKLASNTTFELLSIQGLLLQKGILGPMKHKIDLSSYIAGTYIIRLQSANRNYNQLIEKVDFN